jgi:hypothetical protein
VPPFIWSRRLSRGKFRHGMAVKSGPGAFWLGAFWLGKFWSGKAVKFWRGCSVRARPGWVRRSRRGRARSGPLEHGTARRSWYVPAGYGALHCGMFWRSINI